MQQFCILIICEIYLLRKQLDGNNDSLNKKKSGNAQMHPKQYSFNSIDQHDFLSTS